MIKEYKGVFLCILSFIVSFISSILIIYGAYKLNTILIYVALIVLLVAMLLMIYGIILIVKKYKEKKKNEV